MYKANAPVLLWTKNLRQRCSSSFFCDPISAGVRDSGLWACNFGWCGFAYNYERPFLWIVGSKRLGFAIDIVLHSWLLLLASVEFLS
ncbi:hypothetical protein P8452_26198 [Trifolium repens]|nr:hypothetical protein P8452_26198 [Trifolium repens]